MKIIVAIDGPRNQYHESLEPERLKEDIDGGGPGSGSGRDPVKRQAPSDTSYAPATKKEPGYKPETKMEPSVVSTQPDDKNQKTFQPLHAITMHLTDSPIVTFYVFQQILVLRGMKFDKAIEKAKEIVEEDITTNQKHYDKYEDIVSTLTKAAQEHIDDENSETMASTPEKINNGIDNDTEIIFLYSSSDNKFST